MLLRNHELGDQSDELFDFPAGSHKFDAGMIYRGSCHCGAVRFEVEAPAQLEVDECNCSICSMSAYLHLIVPRNRFRLLSGADQLSSYRFGTGIAEHQFCRHCGIKAFYTPRSNPDGVSVNARCLDDDLKSLAVTPFDGQNWERNAHKVAHKSRDE
jgi:hypothetical protein